MLLPENPLPKGIPMMDNKFQAAADTARALFADLALTELTLRDGDFELTLKKATPTATVAAPLPAPATPLPATPTAPTPAVENNQSALVNCKEVKSPLVGVLYLASAPGAKPFVSVGDRVAKGDVLCIVEAMKMMNELTSDYEGTVLDICADNEALVEYGQVLFKIG